MKPALRKHNLHFSFGLPGFAFATVLLTLVCVAASCGPARPVGRGPHCAFSDPEFTTSLGICNIVAEYYAANHEWPTTRAQLDRQWKTMLESDKKETSPEQTKDLSEFLARFTLLDFRKKDDRLVFHFRFKGEAPKRVVSQTVTFKPGTTAEEILQSATASEEETEGAAR